jgi:hypothetical protein
MRQVSRTKVAGGKWFGRDDVRVARTDGPGQDPDRWDGDHGTAWQGIGRVHAAGSGIEHLEVVGREQLR